MRTTFGIAFYCRNCKASKKTGKSPVEIGLSLNGKRVFIQLPRKEKPEDFKKLTGQKKANELKDFCSAMEANINSAMTELMRNGIPLTVDSIKAYIQTGGIRTYTVGDMFDDYLSYLRKRIGVDLTAGAYRKYVLTKELFLKKAEMKESDEITKLTNSILINFYAVLKSEYKSASSASYMSKLKTIVKFAEDNGKILTNPFATVKIRRDKPVIDYLNESELNALLNLKLDNNSLTKALDLFLLQCYSGLSYIDLEHLTREDIKCDNGNYYIEKKRIKSGVNYTAFVLPQGVEILKKYGFSIPTLSNQKMNTYLHQVEAIAGIGKSIHSHLGRHTYAYLLLNRYKVRAETTARAMGHTSSKTTLKFYAEITKETVVSEISQAFKMAQ